MARFKKGDKVEIVGNIPFTLKDKRPILGTVTSVDGAYIYVKPRYQRWEGEWYANELRLIKHICIDCRGDATIGFTSWIDSKSGKQFYKKGEVRCLQCHKHHTGINFN